MICDTLSILTDNQGPILMGAVTKIANHEYSDHGG